MTATKIQPGDDTHLTLLMAPHSLNFVTGAVRAALLAYGRDVFAAARASQCLAQIEEPAGAAPAAVAGPAWDKTRDSLATLLLGLARRPFLDFDVACIALDAATEPGMPLGYMRGASAAPALEAPPAVAPQGEYPHEQMDAMALARYKVVPSHASMLWSHAVVAGDGAQQLYVGREVECQNMARKFAGAFLDGAFAFHSMAAAPTAQAAPALEAPAVPAGDEEAAFTKWFQGEQGKPYQGMWEFARAAWLARATPASTVAAALIRLDSIYREEADCDEPPQRPDWLVNALHLAAAAPQAPAAPGVVLCYIRAAATLPERHGFEVCRATDAGAMAVTGDGRVAAAAEPASKRIGQILNPESEQSQATGAVVVAEIMSNGYNGQVLWKGKVPPVGTLLYAAPQAAPAAPAVDAFTHAELLEIKRAVEEFADCNETDVDYALLLRAAQAGYLECTQFHVLNQPALDLDTVAAAQAKEGGAA